MAKYIQNTQLQYAPVNREQLHVVVEILAQLNDPNVGHQFTGHPTLSATRVDAFLVPAL